MTQSGRSLRDFLDDFLLSIRGNQMLTDTVNRWLTLSANIGVIAGLILVAVQISQNTQIMKAQIVNDYYLADMNLELTMMGDDPAVSWTKAVFAPNELNHVDAAVLDRYFNYGIVQIDRLRKMHEVGLADDDWEDRIYYLSWHFGNEVGRRWWENYKDGGSDDFTDKVDEILTSSGHIQNQDLLNSIMPAVQTE
jgi:hypothetical protein